MTLLGPYTYVGSNGDAVTGVLCQMRIAEGRIG